jgi:hypothetical protein
MSRYYQTSMSQPVDFGYDLPFEQMQQALLMKNAYQEQSLAQSELLGEVQNVREVDKPLISKYKENLDSQIEELSRMDLTSREGRQKFNDLSKTVRKAVGPTGAIGAAYNNYAQEQAYIKHIKEHKDMSPNRKNELIQLVTSGQYNPAVIEGEIGDFSGGKYSQYRTIEPAKEVDIAKDLDERLKGFIANSFSKEEDKVRGGWIYRHKTTDEVVKPEEIMEASLGIINSNPDLYYPYIEEGAMLGMPGFTDETVFNPILPFSAIDPKTNQEVQGYMPNPNSPLGQAIGYVVNKYAHTKTSESDTQREDPYYSKLYSKKLAEEEATPTIDFESEPTKVKVGTFFSVNKDASEAGTNVAHEIQRLKNDGVANISPAIRFLDANGLEATLESLEKQNTNNQLDELINLVSELHLNKVALKNIEKEAFEYGVQNIKTQRGKDWVLENIQKGRIKINPNTGRVNDQEALDLIKNNPELYKEMVSATFNFRISTEDILVGGKGKVLNKNNNEYNLPSMQSAKFTQYDNDGLSVDDSFSNDVTKAFKQIAKEGNVGNALVYAVKDGVIKKETASSVPKGSSVVFDKIPRADGKRYAVFSFTDSEGTVKQSAMPLEGMVVDGRKISNSVNSEIDAALVALVQKGLDGYRFPVQGKNIELKFDSKEAVKNYIGSKRFSNNNQIVLDVEGEKYYNEEAIRALAQLKVGGIIRLPRIK